MKQMTEKVFDAQIKNLEEVLGFIGDQINNKNTSVKLQNNINIAVEEIFVNIARYAYNPGEGSVKIKVGIVDIDNEIVIEFEDSGVMFNPLEKEDPDINAPAHEREIGGLGIFMVKKIVDSIEYKYEDKKNILTIKKRIEYF